MPRMFLPARRGEQVIVVLTTERGWHLLLVQGLNQGYFLSRDSFFGILFRQWFGTALGMLNCQHVQSCDFLRSSWP